MKMLKMLLTVGLFSLAIAIAGLAFEPSTAWAQAAQKYNDEGKRSFPFPTPPVGACSIWLRSKRRCRLDEGGDGRIVVTAAKKSGVRSRLLKSTGTD
jgi:hypothetical protein